VESVPDIAPTPLTGKLASLRGKLASLRGMLIPLCGMLASLPERIITLKYMLMPEQMLLKAVWRRTCIHRHFSNEAGEDAH
jgi:hypothetical protein